MKGENIPYSSRIKTRDSATCDASREYVMDRAPWPQPARLRHHREWFKIVLSLCPLFRFRRPRRRVVKCHKTASNGRLSQSPAVQSKNKESKKGNRVWFKCLEVVTQWLWQFTTGTAKFPCRRLNWQGNESLVISKNVFRYGRHLKLSTWRWKDLRVSLHFRAFLA